MRRSDQSLESIRSDARVKALRRERQRFSDDPYRPRYHFVPPGGILHDPNGACFWNGRYHLFYQFWPPNHPTELPWHEAMHWGHAISTDLVHWEDAPIALSPETGPESSCYSGQALVEDDRVILMYHGPDAGNCIATSADPLLTDFEKHPANPVIPLEDDDPHSVFDPDIWFENGHYYSLSGTYTGGERGEDCHVIMHLYRSDDLETWDYVGHLLEDQRFTTPGEDGAVPNFFSLGDTDVVLFFSHSHGPQYYLGSYDSATHQFTIDTHGRMNFGTANHGNLHAPSTLSSPDGRRIAFFNINAQRDTLRNQPATGWTELVSLPRELDVENGTLTIRPVDELKTLRTNRERVRSRPLPANSETILETVGGRSLELSVTIDVHDAEEVGISVLRSPNATEETTVSYWPAVDKLGLDTSRSTLHTDVRGRPPEIGPLELGADEPLTLRLFIDRSVIEVFANERQCLTSRVFPKRADSTGIALFARRGRAHLESMTVWHMDSIWEQ